MTAHQSWTRRCLVRDGIYQSISTLARRASHQRVAQWFQERDSLLYAEHLERAGEFDAVSAWLAAARQRLDSHEYEGARGRGERAWQLSEASGERAEAGLALARADGSRRFEADHLCMRGIARAARGDGAGGMADLESEARQAGLGPAALALAAAVKRSGDLAIGA